MMGSGRSATEDKYLEDVLDAYSIFFSISHDFRIFWIAVVFKWQSRKDEFIPLA